jgi:NAD(P)-dependent dehydrogenase (short-subunit alcohol dehydrogenase family)
LWSFSVSSKGVKHLYVCDIVDDNLDGLKDALMERYSDVKVTAIASDAADEASVASIIDRALKEEGHLDVFFANAARATGAPLAATDVADLEDTHHVNVTSCFLACKLASEAMKRTSRDKADVGGSIILTASVAGLRSGAGSVDYSASKAAVISLAQTTSWQLARSNIRVNAICPGLIETGMTLPTFDMARQRGTAAKIGQLNPSGRYGVAAEVRTLLFFLITRQIPRLTTSAARTLFACC